MIGHYKDLNYVNYEKFERALKAGDLKRVDGSEDPAQYARADSGFRFRFPFPDEDGHKFCNINSEYGRGGSVTIDRRIRNEPGQNAGTSSIQLVIRQQMLIHRASDRKLCLAIVCRYQDNYQLFRIEDDFDVNYVLKQIFRHHVVKEADIQKRDFYRELALRILKGYSLENIRQRQDRIVKNSPVKTNSKRFKKRRSL